MRQNTNDMNNQVREVEVKAVLPLEGSMALFLGNDDKTFVIYVDESVGNAISMFINSSAKERPLTHDLLGNVLLAFGAKVDRVVINDVSGSVFYARIILHAQNQLQQVRKVIELDARPSDSVAMAMQQKAPIYVADKVWNTVEDVSETLADLEKRSQAAQEAAEEEEDTDDDEDDEDDDDDDFTEEDLFDEDDDDDDDDDEFDTEDEDDEDDDSDPKKR